MRLRVTRPARTVLFGALLEGGLGLVGFLLAWLFGMGLAAHAELTLAGLVWGVLATVPLLALFFAGFRSNWPPLARIRSRLSRTIVPYLEGVPWWGLLVLSIFAGLGEEILFRGVLQSLAARLAGPGPALLLASAIFGLVHWITPFYALFATGLGIYLGTVFLLSGSLFAVALAHAVYDFVALAVYMRTFRHDPQVLGGS